MTISAAPEHVENSPEYSSSRFWNLDLNLVKLRSDTTGEGQLRRCDAREWAGAEGLAAVDFDSEGRLWTVPKGGGIIRTERPSESPNYRMSLVRDDVCLLDFAIEKTVNKLYALDAKNNRLLCWQIGNIRENAPLLIDAGVWHLEPYKMDKTSRLAILTETVGRPVAYVTLPSANKICAIAIDRDVDNPEGRVVEVQLHGAAGETVTSIGKPCAICTDQWERTLIVSEGDRRSILELSPDPGRVGICGKAARWEHPSGKARGLFDSVNDIVMYRARDYVEPKYLLEAEHDAAEAKRLGLRSPRALIIANAAGCRIDKCVRSTKPPTEPSWRPLIGNGRSPSVENSAPPQPQGEYNLLEESIGLPTRLAISARGQLAFLTAGSSFIKVLTPATATMSIAPYRDNSKSFAS